METKNQRQENQEKFGEESEIKQKGTKTLEVFLGVAIIFSILLSLGIVIYFKWLQKPPSSTFEPGEKQVQQFKPEATLKDSEKAQEIEVGISQLQSELNTLDQIEEELNAPEIDLELGL